MLAMLPVTSFNRLHFEIDSTGAAVLSFYHV